MVSTAMLLKILLPLISATYCIVTTTAAIAAIAAQTQTPPPVVLGAAEVVFYGGTSRGSCADYDLPDAPARAWRTQDGVVHLSASWATLYMSSGESLHNTTKDGCRVAFNSTMSGQNSLWIDHEWLVAPWLLSDNNTVIGYMHQEFHGFQHNNCTPNVKPKNYTKDCWMVAMTSTISMDGGYTFAHTFKPPHHLSMAAPYPYLPGQSGFGYGDPSGIVFNHLDNFYYMTTSSRKPHFEVKNGICLQRTSNVSDIHSWKAWDGSDFTIQFSDPYSDTFEPGTEATHVCQPIPGLNFTVLSLKYSTYFEKFIATGEGLWYNPQTNQDVNGYIYSLSDNLLSWGPKYLLRERVEDYPISENYASLLDPDSTDPNFNDFGKSGYFYYTRENASCPPPQCRDLMRQRIEFGAGLPH